jgi:4-hydroxy-2-oxoheptanedioate aldolase
MPCFSPDHGRKLLDMGARFLAHGADIVLLKRALENIQAQFSPLGFHFGS